MKKKTKKSKLIAITAILVLCLALIINVILSNTVIVTKNYILENEKLIEPIRIVHLSDLHNYKFGKNNIRLIEKVKEQNPDLIFMTGDMLNYNNSNFDIAAELVESLIAIAPVYYSIGNHEDMNERKFNNNIVEKMNEAGAVVLDFEYRDIIVNNQSLRVGGIYGYCTPDSLDSSLEFNADTIFMKDFQNTDYCKLLLCHMPASWITNTTLDYWDVDFVFSGHVHGGQIRIPFIGGVYGPDLGFFPGNVRGIYKSKDEKTCLILSCGLGSHTMPRVNNLPEIIVVDIVPKA